MDENRKGLSLAAETPKQSRAKTTNPTSNPSPSADPQNIFSFSDAERREEQLIRELFAAAGIRPLGSVRVWLDRVRAMQKSRRDACN
jgi:hypothetical protein